MTTSQIILQMPCLSCEPPCLWPVDPPKQVRVSVFSLVNFVCNDCLFLNGVYFPEFTTKEFTPGGVQCRFESPFLFPVCTISVARVTAVVNPSLDLFLTFDLLDFFGFIVFRWSTVFNPPESLTNGPFLLPIVVGQLQCTINMLTIEVDAV